MNRTARALTAVSLGLAFTVIGTGVGHAAVVPASPAAPTTQCNADPNYDPSLDPVHCHYTHPLSKPDHPLPDSKANQGNPKAN
jgi:hypothetical protein